MTMEKKFSSIKELSAPVVKYILNEIPPYLGLVVIHTDPEGTVIDTFGPVKKYFEKIPETGQTIDSFAGFFVGMIPPLINPMVVSHVRMTEDVYAEIHIVNDENKHNWVFIVDQTKQVEIIHPIIQLYNEEKLARVNDTHQSRAKGTLSALYLLDYMSFEKDATGYRLLGTAPDWFKSIQAKLFFNGKNVELTETFPYIEVFQYEAESVWTSEEDGKMVSGIWEETNNKGEKIYLQALALCYEKRNYLLIKPLDKDTDLNDGFLQKAREQKLTLDQLASTEKKLKQLLGFKDQFVSIISHDLRSPIGAVIGLTEMLLTDDELVKNINPSQLEVLSDIKNEMYRLLDYNDKLFQWSNLELGNFKVAKVSISGENLASHIEKMHAAKVKEKQIELKTTLESQFTFYGDETLMIQVLNNLVGNAVKFTPEKGQISLRFSHKNGGKEITISDSGIGMDTETQNKLFCNFTRKTTIGTYGERGTGLGLGIVKKILDAHGFDIQVTSRPWEGSTFTITIPN